MASGLSKVGFAATDDHPSFSSKETIMSVKARPEGYHSVTPYIIVDGAAEAIRWYEEALGAREMYRLTMPVPSDAAGDVEGGDKVGHAEILIGDSHIMLSDEWPDYGIHGPVRRGGPTATFMIYVDDVEAAFERAVAAGGKVDKPIEDQFYGDRSGTIEDPFGHKWTLATHVEDVTEDEMKRRMAAWSTEAANA
jgi:PhnB protein